MEVIEFHSPNDGRDPCSILIRRHKIPKNRDDTPETFPSICMELSGNLVLLSMSFNMSNVCNK